MVVHDFNPSTGEAEAGRSLWVQTQPGLQSEFQDRPQSYKEKLSLKKKKKKERIVVPNIVIPGGKSNDISKFAGKWVDILS